jgi:hypothetical protein
LLVFDLVTSVAVKGCGRYVETGGGELFAIAATRSFRSSFCRLLSLRDLGQGFGFATFDGADFDPRGFETRGALWAPSEKAAGSVAGAAGVARAPWAPSEVGQCKELRSLVARVERKVSASFLKPARVPGNISARVPGG